MSFSRDKELKPCPFCGGDVKLTYPDGKNGFGKLACVIECQNCGQLIHYHNVVVAHEHWNRRNAGEAFKVLVEAARTAWYGEHLD